MENKKSVYMPWLDVAKGIGIILVVIGHAMFPKHLIIDGFHMALFFILSGVTFSTNDTFFNFTKKKFMRILLPCLFWALVWIVTGIPNIPIWFLYTLFFGFVLLYPLIRYLSVYVSAALVLSVSLLLCGEHSILPMTNQQIARIVVGTTFIYIGYFAKYLIINPPRLLQDLVCKIKNMNWHRLTIAFVAIITIVLYLVVLLGGEKLGYYSELSFGKMTLFQINWGLLMLITLCGTLATVLFSVLLQNNKVLQWFGKNSLVIMCVHFPLAERLNYLMSTMPHFDNPIHKIGYGFIEYVVLLSFSTIMVFFCNRFLPTLTGGIKSKWF